MNNVLIIREKISKMMACKFGYVAENHYLYSVINKEL